MTQLYVYQILYKIGNINENERKTHFMDMKQRPNCGERKKWER